MPKPYPSLNHRALGPAIRVRYIAVEAETGQPLAETDMRLFDAPCLTCGQVARRISRYKGSFFCHTCLHRDTPPSPPGQEALF